MSNEDTLDDDYVAKLLAKDAKESSVKYSTIGLQAFAQSKPPANKPKPNTRFLQNIIKSTDSHNQALLAKEAAEARARLRDLPPAQSEEKPKRVGNGDIRRRQLGDIAAILGGRTAKRRRPAKTGASGRRVNTSSEDEAEVEEKVKIVKPDREFYVGPRQRRLERSEKEEDGGLRGEKRSSKRRRSRSRDTDDRKRRHRSRSRSPREHRNKESRHRDRSLRRKRSRSPDSNKIREKSYRSHRHQHSPPPGRQSKVDYNAQSSRKPDLKRDYDSDPLDDIIGPRPPPVEEIQTRGRGTISHASGIDSRFSASYDPKSDVQLDPDEENDWADALEALRDRQKWQATQSERLKAAGFSEEEVAKWEKGGEKKEVDVKWAKKGESREWDRGKVVDDEGVVMAADPDFGRLKNT